MSLILPFEEGKKRTAWSEEGSKPLFDAARRILNMQAVGALKLSQKPDGGYLIELADDPDKLPAGDGSSSFFNTAQTYLATCPTGTIGSSQSVTVAAGTVGSNVSQADADALALELATDRATSQLVCNVTATVGLDNSPTLIEVTSAGLIAVVGSFSSAGGIIRDGVAVFYPNLTLHPASWHLGFPAGFGIQNLGLAVNSVNSLAVAGTFTSVNAYALDGSSTTIAVTGNGIASLISSGLKSSTFDPGTGWGPNNAFLVCYPSCLAYDSSDRLLCGGGGSNSRQYRSSNVSGLIRIAANGTLQKNFDFKDPSNTFAPGFPTINRMRVDGNNKIHMIGNFGSIGSGYYYDGVQYHGGSFMRLESHDIEDGFVDAGFGGAGPSDFAFDVSSYYIFTGSFTNYNGTARIGVCRISSNGTLDTAYNPISSKTGTITGVETDGTGKAYVFGNFTVINGTTRYGIVRIDATGAIDSAFNTPTLTKAAGTVTISCAKVLSNGSIVIGGDFTSIGGHTVNRLAILDSTGALVYPEV